MALFGEKYGDEVRVVSMGKAADGDKRGKTYSVELCGGTHVGRTGEIGLVTLVGEAAVAAGVRRIEALTGAAARRHLSEQDSRVREIAGMLKVRPDEAVARLEALIEERRKLERDLADARKKIAMGGGGIGGEPAVEADRLRSTCWPARSRVSRRRTSAASSIRARSRSARASSPSSA